MWIELNTDYKDYYDSEFSTKGNQAITKWNRNLLDLNISSTKSNQFKLLNELGFQTPRHGIVSQLSTEVDYLVIYLNGVQPRNRVLRIESNSAVSLYSQNYCREYITSTFSARYRLIQIGYRTFWHQYSNDQLIKSLEIFNWWNKYSIFQKVAEYPRPPVLNRFPIFTIDFIDSQSGDMKFVTDLNTSPIFSGTGVEKLMSPVNIHAAVNFFFNKAYQDKHRIKH